MSCCGMEEESQSTGGGEVYLGDTRQGEAFHLLHFSCRSYSVAVVVKETEGERSQGVPMNNVIRGELTGASK